MFVSVVSLLYRNSEFRCFGKTETNRNRTKQTETSRTPRIELGLLLPNFINLSLELSVLQNSVLSLDVSALEQPMLPLEVSVRQQPLLPLDVLASVLRQTLLSVYVYSTAGFRIRIRIGSCAADFSLLNLPKGKV
jgi:hypothetical protein